MPFAGVAGHRRLLTLFARAVARETLPPSLLFAGPAGVGKRRTAMAIAEVLNCASPRASNVFEVDACGTCASCRRIARSVHPDVMVLEPGDTGKIRIEPVREVIDAANYRPFEGRRRTVIIDEADRLMPQAQNALLKTLEEPPSASVFILVSSVPESLLPTVRSRCRPLRFSELSPVEVAGVLMREHRYDEPAAQAAAANAGGSVGRALTASSIDVTEARTAARRLLQHVARAADPSGRLHAVKDLTGKPGPLEREQLAACLRAMSSLVRDLSALSARADIGLANADLQADLEWLMKAFDTRRSMRAFSAVDEALAALRGNVNANPKVVADWLVVQL